MSIVESANTKRNRSARLGSLAGAALVSAAVFATAPKAAQGVTTWIETGNDSWFNTSQWANGTVTGILPESGGLTVASPSANINANNATMPATGVLFDPANQISNANYVAKAEVLTNNSASFYISSANSSTNSLNAALNKLTVDSGTFETFTMTIGRDFSGILVLNGGQVQTDSSLKVGGANSAGDGLTAQNGSGTFEYHGGNLLAKNAVQIAAGNNNGVAPADLTIPAVGKFVVYNDGVDGSIAVSNGFSIAANTQNAGTIGIVEFHYDTNTNHVGNTRPIQANPTTTNAQLKISNSTNQLSELNLVLDTQVSLGLNALQQNLGLFKENTVTGVATFPKIFYATDGTTGYTQGATVSALFGGSTYSWTISYSGIITFTNTATSTYSGDAIAATGGNDVVLIGISAIPVPEPTSMALLGGAGSLILARRRQKKA